MIEPPVVTIVVASDRAGADLAAFLREHDLIATSVDGTERVVAASASSRTAEATRRAVEPYVEEWRASSGYEALVVTQATLPRTVSSRR